MRDDISYMEVARKAWVTQGDIELSANIKQLKLRIVSGIIN